MQPSGMRYLLTDVPDLQLLLQRIAGSIGCEQHSKSLEPGGSRKAQAGTGDRLTSLDLACPQRLFAADALGVDGVERHLSVGCGLHFDGEPRASWQADLALPGCNVSPGVYDPGGQTGHQCRRRGCSCISLLRLDLGHCIRRGGWRWYPCSRNGDGGRLCVDHLHWRNFSRTRPPLPKVAAPQRE